MDYVITTGQGFEQMYREYFPKTYNYIFYRILSREETEDLVSEIFMKVAKNARSFDERKASFQTWIYTIAKNALNDYYVSKYYRSKRNQLSLDDEDAGVVASVDFEEQLRQISSEERRILYGELVKLRERERLIVYYKFFEGYNNRQIALLLEMNESTVGTVLSRTLKKLRTPEIQALT